MSTAMTKLAMIMLGSIVVIMIIATPVIMSKAILMTMINTSPVIMMIMFIIITILIAMMRAMYVISHSAKTLQNLRTFPKSPWSRCTSTILPGTLCPTRCRAQTTSSTNLPRISTKRILTIRDENRSMRI